MRRIINSTFVTLDGLQDKLEQWHFEYNDDEMEEILSAALFASDALLMGRATYDGFAAAWPGRAGDPMADKFNAMAKYVASTTLTNPEWENTSVLDGDLATAVRALKEQPGEDIITYGIGPVVRTLLEHGLLDVLRLFVHPIIFGTGEPSDLLFGPAPTTRFDLVEAKPLPSGVVVLSYEPGSSSA